MKHIILITTLIFTAGLAEAAGKKHHPLHKFAGIYTVGKSCEGVEKGTKAYVGYERNAKNKIIGLEINIYSELTGYTLAYGKTKWRNPGKNLGAGDVLRYERDGSISGDVLNSRLIQYFEGYFKITTSTLTRNGDVLTYQSSDDDHEEFCELIEVKEK